MSVYFQSAQNCFYNKIIKPIVCIINCGAVMSALYQELLLYLECGNHKLHGHKMTWRSLIIQRR